jgi:hypothetical protein
MSEKIIKHRLFTWFEEVDSPVMPGTTVLAERIAHFGEKVDITNPAYIKRGEELDSFYTDKEAKEIEKGTYRGTESTLLYAARSGTLQAPTPLIEPIEGEHGGLDSMSTEQLAEYMVDNKLTVDQTLALLPAEPTEDEINKLLDAENLASENEPRASVTKALEAKLNAATKG